MLPAATCQGRSGGNLFGECGPICLPWEWGFNIAIVKVVLLEPVWVTMAAGGSIVWRCPVYVVRQLGAAGPVWPH